MIKLAKLKLYEKSLRSIKFTIVLVKPETSVKVP